MSSPGHSKPVRQDFHVNRWHYTSTWNKLVILLRKNVTTGSTQNRFNDFVSLLKAKKDNGLKRNIVISC